MFVKLSCIPNFSFLGELEVMFPGGWVGGWCGLRLIIRLSQFQLNLTGTATGTELGNTDNRICLFTKNNNKNYKDERMSLIFGLV